MKTTIKPVKAAWIPSLLFCLANHFFLPVNPAYAEGNPPAPPSVPLIERGAAGSLRTIGAYPEERGTGHTVTVLADGRVFVYGYRPDRSANDAVNLDPKFRTKEINKLAPVIWDPQRKGWRTTPSPPECPNAAYLHTATALSRGRILIAGGFCDPPRVRGDPRVSPSYTAMSLWNDDSGKWEAVPALKDARIFHTATAIDEDSVIFIGGESDALISKDVQPVLDSVEMFRAGKLLALPSLHFARAKHTATKRADGSVVVAGGMSSDGKAMDHVEIWDPIKQGWRDGPPLLNARFGHTAALLSDGRLLVAGGIDQNEQTMRSVEILDPAGKQWTDAAPLLVPLKRLSSVALENGNILLAGEGHDGMAPYSQIMLWESASAQWLPAGQLFPERFKGAMSYQLARMPLKGSNAFVFDFKSVMQWSPASTGATADAPFGLRAGYASILLKDGRIMLAGGGNLQPNGQPGAIGVDWVEIFDPASAKFTITGRLNQPKHSISALALDDGGVVATFNRLAIEDLTSPPPPHFAELWSPVTGKWRAIDELQSAGADWSKFQKMGKLRDGRVLFIFYVSFKEKNGYRALIWDPRTSAVESKLVPVKMRLSPAIAITPQGKVLIFGLDGNREICPPEIWDSETGNAEPLPNPANAYTEREEALVLKNGDVLWVGAPHSRSETATVSKWSSALGTLRELPPLPINKDWDRAVHGLAELNDGTIITDTLWLMHGASAWTAVQRYPQTEAIVTQLPSGRLLALSSSPPYVAYFSEQYKLWDVADGFYLQRKEKPRPVLVELADGGLMVSGSLDLFGLPQAPTTQIWDSKSNTWQTTGKLTHIYSSSPEAIRLASGQIMHLGFDREGVLKCEIGHPRDNIWNDCGASTPLAAARSQFTLAQLSNGEVALMFGEGEVYTYNESSAQWLAFKGNLSQLLKSPTGMPANAFPLPDGCFISGPPFLIYNPKTRGELRPLVPVTGIKDRDARMVALTDGTVAVAGYPDGANGMGYGFFHRKATCAGFESQDGDDAFMPAVYATPSAPAAIMAPALTDSSLDRNWGALGRFKWIVLAVLGPALLYFLARRFARGTAAGESESSVRHISAFSARVVLYILGAIFLFILVSQVAPRLIQVVKIGVSKATYPCRFIGAWVSSRSGVMNRIYLTDDGRYRTDLFGTVTGPAAISTGTWEIRGDKMVWHYDEDKNAPADVNPIRDEKPGAFTLVEQNGELTKFELLEKIESRKCTP